METKHTVKPVAFASMDDRLPHASSQQQQQRRFTRHCRDDTTRHFLSLVLPSYSVRTLHLHYTLTHPHPVKTNIMDPYRTCLINQLIPARFLSTTVSRGRTVPTRC